MPDLENFETDSQRVEKVISSVFAIFMTNVEI